MPNGMTQAPIGEKAGGWQITSNADQFGVSSIHKIPQEQFIHELKDEATCLCGPQISYQAQGQRVVPLIHHHPLDQDYYWSDWGPDGPELDPERL